METMRAGGSLAGPAKTMPDSDCVHLLHQSCCRLIDGRSLQVTQRVQWHNDPSADGRRQDCRWEVS